jgi:hypothetical protein
MGQMKSGEPCGDRRQGFAEYGISVFHQGSLIWVVGF